MCKHNNDHSTHTASGFDYDDSGCQLEYQREYCVYCIHEKYSDRESYEVALDLLAKNISWSDGSMKEHNIRIANADLDYAIFISERGDIIDGCHRVTKARNLGLAGVRAIILSPDDLAECIFDLDVHKLS